MLKVLLIIEQCNPEWPSVPLEGFRYYEAIRRHVNVTLVTHARNRGALERAGITSEVVFIQESATVARYFQVVRRLAIKEGRVNWPILYALGYPVYAEFNRRAFREFSGAVSRGHYDVVHAFSPILPRYPVKLIEACRQTPFVLGPVNGGLPFPPGFAEIARKEFNRFNFLRTFSRAIPGYRATYQQADKVLAGSSATEKMLRRMFGIADDRIELLHENGVMASSFGKQALREPGDPIRLLFVGRLVPFKCADVVMDAFARMDSGLSMTLTIVGDGPERPHLEDRSKRMGVTNRVSFAGWVAHERTVEFYRRADIFCFPSIREFGGAVVLEALAAGLPCIVMNYGGIGEYVTDDCGFRITPGPREDVVQELAHRIETLASSADLRNRMSAAAMVRAREFEWGRKAQRIVDIYAALIEKKHVVKTDGCA